ncbi:hypothetical protein [Tropicibacter sp. S64]|uniref:hypothetical protein n=1 Tax=Tropicibacter sp. S64 TaxID=3415122 RepID=UPI003C798A2D
MRPLRILSPGALLGVLCSGYAMAQGTPPALLEEPVQAGDLLVSGRTCPAVVVGPRHATVAAECLLRQAEADAQVTEIVVFIRDGDGLPLYRAPVLGWIAAAGAGPQPGPLYQVQIVSHGLVLLAVEPGAWTLSEPDALPPRPYAGPGGLAEVRVTRALAADRTANPQDTCPARLGLPDDPGFNSAILCTLVRGNALANAEDVPGTARINRGVRAGPVAGEDASGPGVPASPEFERRAPAAKFVKP